MPTVCCNLRCLLHSRRRPFSARTIFISIACLWSLFGRIYSVHRFSRDTESSTLEHFLCTTRAPQVGSSRLRSFRAVLTDLHSDHTLFFSAHRDVCVRPFVALPPRALRDSASISSFAPIRCLFFLSRIWYVVHCCFTRGHSSCILFGILSGLRYAVRCCVCVAFHASVALRAACLPDAHRTGSLSRILSFISHTIWRPLHLFTEHHRFHCCLPVDICSGLHFLTMISRHFSFPRILRVPFTFVVFARTSLTFLRLSDDIPHSESSLAFGNPSLTRTLPDS